MSERYISTIDFPNSAIDDPKQSTMNDPQNNGGSQNEYSTIMDGSPAHQGRLPPIDRSSNNVQLTNMTKVGVENEGYVNTTEVSVIQPSKNGPLNSENGTPKRNGDVEIVTDPDKVENPGPADDAPVDFDPEEKPLFFCSFIVDHHRLAFGVTLAVQIFFIVLTGILMVAGYSILPLEFEGVPLFLKDDNTYLRQQAWLYRNEDPIILLANTSSELVGARTSNGDILQTFFRAGNVLTRKRLKAIEKVEKDLIEVDNYNDTCKSSSDGTCLKPTSLIRFFDGTYGVTDTNFDDIPGTLNQHLANEVTKQLLEGLLGSGYTITATTAKASLTRILFFLGTPLVGYDLTTDSLEDQDEKFRDFEVDYWRDKLYDYEEDGVAGMDFNFLSTQLFFNDIFNQVILDLMLALGSFGFIFIFMLFQTGSLWLTSFSLFGIYASFFGCNLVYRIILDYEYFGTFNVLAIFIILGIGADNIFVFNDTWRATAHERHAGMAERLSSCYRRATKSMANTTLTTFVAFLSNALSPLLGVSSFGIFSAVLVAVNFLTAITFFPTVLIMYHKNYEDWKWPCFKPCKKLKIYPCAERDSSKTGHRPNVVVRFFKGPFHKAVTHKIFRFVFILACAGAIGTFTYFNTQVKVSEEQIQFYVDGENYQEATELNNDGFERALDDRNVEVVVAFGLKNQDQDDCHKTDLDCKGKTVWDESFDLNPKPAQIQLQEWCERIRDMPPTDHTNLRLKYDPQTSKVEIECFLINMDTYMTANGNNATPTQNLSLPTSEVKLEKFFTVHSDLYDTAHVYGDSFYRFFETIKAFWLNGGYESNTADTDDYRDFSVMMGESRDQYDTALIKGHTDDYYGTRLRYAGFKIKTTLIRDTLAFDDGLDLADAWEDYVDDEVAKLPPSLQGGFMLTPDNTFHDFKVKQVLAQSAVTGVILGLCLAFVVLTLATTNVIISLMATINILCVVVSVGGMIPIIGWKISVIESLNLSLVVGLAVDYVVHLSESYHHSSHDDRVLKVRDMLEAMGVSVLSGACSTMGAAIFMMFARIMFFVQFGIFIFITIGFSLIYSLCLFTPALGIMGPTGQIGSLGPVVKWVIRKIKGRGKDDPDCDKCEGKGFLKADSTTNTDL